MDKPLEKSSAYASGCRLAGGKLRKRVMPSDCGEPETVPSLAELVGAAADPLCGTDRRAANIEGGATFVPSQGPERG